MGSMGGDPGSCGGGIPGLGVGVGAGGAGGISGAQLALELPDSRVEVVQQAGLRAHQAAAVQLVVELEPQAHQELLVGQEVRAVVEHRVGAGALFFSLEEEKALFFYLSYQPR